MSDMRDFNDTRAEQISREVQDHLRAQNEKLQEELAKHTNDCVRFGGPYEKCSMVIADRMRRLYGDNQQLEKERDDARKEVDRLTNLPAPAIMNAEDYGLYLVLRDLVRDAALAPAAREKLLNFLSRMDV